MKKTAATRRRTPSPTPLGRSREAAADAFSSEIGGQGRGTPDGGTSGSIAKARKRDAAATRARILEAAMEEFTVHGLPETRIEDIAARAGVNRRMIYYYFGSKEGLYLAALETVYAELLEEERKIDVDNVDPVEAIATLVGLKINHYTCHPRFITFVNMENLYRARHLRNSRRLGEFKSPLTSIIERVLERGQRSGLFRRDVDPIDLYISICALGYMYFSNQHTFGVIFERNLISPDALAERKKTIADIIVSYLTNRDDGC